MMLSLPLNVPDDPLQILRPETHHPVPRLPLQDPPVGHFMIDLVSARTLQRANPIADRQRRRNTHCQVNVIIKAADCMNANSVRRNRPIPKIPMQPRLDISMDRGRTVLRMPCDVQIDFRVNRPGHCGNG